MLEKTAIVILAEFAMTMQEFQNHMLKPHLKVFICLSLAHGAFLQLGRLEPDLISNNLQKSQVSSFFD